MTICRDSVPSLRETSDMGRDRSKIDPDLAPPVPLRKNRGRPPDPRRKRPVEKRTCQRHGLTDFAHYSAGPERGYRWRCKRCVAEAVTRRLQRVKRMLVEEAGGRCAVCGYERCIINLHFHHVDPSKKSFSMTVAMGKSIATFREEAKKCVLVCANCHGEIEAGMIASPPPGAKFKGSRLRAA